MSLHGPRLEPEFGTPRQLVVLLHGIGADGDDLLALGSHWQEFLPHALFVAPNAPEPAFGGPNGYQWFALSDDRAASRAAGIPAAAQVLRHYLDGLWAETGLGPRDTILVGFSQGAMMALYVGLTLAEAPKGIVAFSGALLPPPGLAEGNLPKPPVCLVHGDQDQVVDHRASLDAAEILKAAGYEVSLHIAPGIGHGIDPDGLAFASAFIAGISATL